MQTQGSLAFSLTGAGNESKFCGWAQVLRAFTMVRILKILLAAAVPLCAELAYGGSSGEEVEEAIDSFFRRTPGGTQSVRAVGAEFFSAVALGQMAEGETGGKLQSLTEVNAWKSQTVSGVGPGSGWLKFVNTMWIPSGGILSPRGARVCESFRFSLQDGEPPEDSFAADGKTWRGSGDPGSERFFLLSEASFSPRIPGGLFVARGAGGGGDGSRTMLHTKILSVQYAKGGGGGLCVKIPLEGGGELLLCEEVAADGSGEWTRGDAIVFLPEATLRASYQPEWAEADGAILGPDSGYGENAYGGRLSLARWMVDAQVRFGEHRAKDQDYIPGDGADPARPPRPVLLRFDKGSRFEVKGGAGGVFFSGRFPGE